MPIKTKLVGVTKKNDDGTSRQDILEEMQHKGWQRITLEYEKDNPKSDHAIAAYNDAGEQVGYLNDDLAADLVDDIEALGGSIYARILNISGGEDKAYGCNIEIQGLEDIASLTEEDKKILIAPSPSKPSSFTNGCVWLIFGPVIGGFAWAAWKFTGNIVVAGIIAVIFFAIISQSTKGK